ncbi:MAG TPA: hypothetical protein VGL53_18625 [Bryobacteraceae bacterium]|jgi:uncharacterized protein (UPF0332 family)
MAFPDDLLELSRHLANLYPEHEHQASLRRAVSTAYYAIFHLLISEAAANWARPELRTVLSRCFDHGPMKSASEARAAQINFDLNNNRLSETDKTIAAQLRTVAKAFVRAQYERNEADYNLAKQWTAVDVNLQIDSVAEAFEIWGVIREEELAQAYLLSLLGTRERRPNDDAED